METPSKGKDRLSNSNGYLPLSGTSLQFNKQIQNSANGVSLNQKKIINTN